MSGWSSARARGSRDPAAWPTCASPARAAAPPPPPPPLPAALFLPQGCRWRAGAPAWGVLPTAVACESVTAARALQQKHGHDASLAGALGTRKYVLASISSLLYLTDHRECQPSQLRFHLGRMIQAALRCVTGWSSPRRAQRNYRLAVLPNIAAKGLWQLQVHCRCTCRRSRSSLTKLCATALAGVAAGLGDSHASQLFDYESESLCARRAVISTPCSGSTQLNRGSPWPAPHIRQESGIPPATKMKLQVTHSGRYMDGRDGKSSAA